MYNFTDKNQVLQFMLMEKFRSKLNAGEKIKKANNYAELFALFLSLEWIPNKDEISLPILRTLVNLDKFTHNIELNKEMLLSVNFKKIQTEMSAMSKEETITDLNVLKAVFMGKIEVDLLKFSGNIKNQEESFRYLHPINSLYKKTNNYNHRLNVLYRTDHETELVKETEDVVFNNICHKIEEEFSDIRKEIVKFGKLVVFLFEIKMDDKIKKQKLKEKLADINIKEEIKELMLKRAYMVINGDENYDL